MRTALLQAMVHGHAETHPRATQAILDASLHLGDRVLARRLADRVHELILGNETGRGAIAPRPRSSMLNVGFPALVTALASSASGTGGAAGAAAASALRSLRASLAALLFLHADTV